jgi:hypothetical protein
MVRNPKSAKSSNRLLDLVQLGGAGFAQPANVVPDPVGVAGNGKDDTRCILCEVGYSL